MHSKGEGEGRTLDSRPEGTESLTIHMVRDLSLYFPKNRGPEGLD